MLAGKLAELFGEMENVRGETLAALSGLSEEEMRRRSFVRSIRLYEWPSVTILMHERDHLNQPRKLLDHLREERE